MRKFYEIVKSNFSLDSFINKILTINKYEHYFET